MQAAFKQTQMSQITPESVLNQYPWLKQRNLPMVTHNDLDGLLTALILHQELGWKLVGVYDLKTIHFDSTFTGDIRDVIYVDLDVTHKSFRSMGHHILGSDEGEHLNINRLFNIGHSQYTSKYPLSTAVFLFWLFKKDFFELPQMAKLFLLHSDSSWKNYRDYTRNVKQWFKRFGMEDVLAYLEDPRIIPSIEKYVLPNTFSFNNQCTYLARNGKFVFRDSKYDVQEYVDALAKIFNYERLIMPTNLVERAKFNRKEFSIQNNLEETLNDIRSRHRVFSYSVKYAGKIDVSYV